MDKEAKRKMVKEAWVEVVRLKEEAAVAVAKAKAIDVSRTLGATCYCNVLTGLKTNQSNTSSITLKSKPPTYPFLARLRREECQ